MLGFPIRKSSDLRSVDSSPRHIAASHVLHRLLMPRHPPYALKHLQTQKPKVFKKQNHTNKQNPTKEISSARCSQPLSTTQTPHPTPKPVRRQHPKRVASGPNSVPGSHHSKLNDINDTHMPSTPLAATVCCCAPTGTPTTGAGINHYPNRHESRTLRGDGGKNGAP